MNNRYKGDQLGEVDQDGIAQWYPKCKVRKEGEIYYATPHTTNPTRRTKHKQKPIAVSVENGIYALEKLQSENTAVNDENGHTNNSNGQVVGQTDKSSQTLKEQTKSNIQITTHKQIFDELYDKYSNLKPHIRRRSILKDMLPLFDNERDAEYFIYDQWGRKRRNIYTRK